MICGSRGWCGRWCAGEKLQTLPEAKSSPGREDCLSYNGGTESGLQSLPLCGRDPFVPTFLPLYLLSVFRNTQNLTTSPNPPSPRCLATITPA